MARVERRRRGFTLIEGIVATFILAVVIVAMFASWSACFKQSSKITEVTEAANIAQSELECAKVFGAANLPTGTYNTTTSSGTWTGAYIPATGWTANSLAYYSYSGAQLASSASTGVYFSVSVTITDTNVLQGTGTSYTIGNNSMRAMVATVTNVSTGVVDFQMATNLFPGGL